MFLVELAGFWLEVLWFAVRDSAAFIWDTWHKFLFSVLVLILTLVWLRVEHGASGMKTKAREAIAPGLLIGAVAMCIVFLCHLIWEPHRMRKSERANTVSEENEKSRVQGELLRCQGDFNLATGNVKHLEESTRTQQVTLNGQQAIINAQQSTVNTCVVSLAKSSATEPLLVSVLPGIIPNVDANGGRVWMLLLMANKPVLPARGVLACGNDFEVANVRIAGSTMIQSERIERINSHSFRVGAVAPSWTPASPMVVFAVAKSEFTNCSFRQD